MKPFLSTLILLILFSSAKATDSTQLIIHFDFDKYNINSVEQAKIDSFILQFDTSKFVLKSVSILGHTDQIGSNSYNDILSKKRAANVAKLLEKFNATFEKNVSIDGFGKMQLLSTSIEENERLLNRRVVITLFYQEKIKPIMLPKIVEEKDPKPIGKSDAPKATYQKLADKFKDTTLKIGDRIELPYILFVGGMHEFLQISYPYLDELFYVMRDNPTLEIEIQGHVCCTNEEDGVDFATGRKNLSYARAREVYYFLKKSGIDPTRMTYQGFGHQFPITQERNEAEKTRNRRVEIKIIKR
ncbi:MAG: OmpA family protein [Chitinophagaceae bacterium]